MTGKAGRKAAKLTVQRERPAPGPVMATTPDPAAWAEAKRLCPDVRRLRPLADGSVLIVNRPWR